jgi:hypothetical protein
MNLLKNATFGGGILSSFGYFHGFDQSITEAIDVLHHSVSQKPRLSPLNQDEILAALHAD